MKNKNKKIYIDIFICFCLSIFISMVYHKIFLFDFINYDTPKYVLENHHVKQGIIIENFTWAFSTTYFSNWHPLTWLAHMIVVDIFGMNPTGHHAINLLIHIINSVLLYWIIKKFSESYWSSIFIAALFAIHPLHIQSVVWVAELKDLLSTMFCFFSILFYYFYKKKSQLTYYLLLIFFFILSLLTKPMLVTLPFILLLIDYWSLNRFKVQKESLHTLIVKKIPLFILTIISSIITIFAQYQGGAVATLSEIPFQIRLLNAMVSYTKYALFMVFPLDLSIIYPYSNQIPLKVIISSILFLVCATSLAAWNIKKRPFIFTGLFLFIGTLLPVIGAIQIGQQAMADRYTYVPLIGLFIIVAGGIIELQKYFKLQKKIRWILGFLILLYFSILSYNQLKYWQNSITLFSRALEITNNNYIAHNNLGHAYLEKNNYDKALKHFREAIKINPDFDIAHLNYGFILTKQGLFSEAVEQYQITLKLNPKNVSALTNLGNFYYRIRKYDKAMENYHLAYKLEPENFHLLNSLGAIMVKKGELNKAIYFFKKTLAVNPESKEAENNLQKVLDVIKGRK